jgi:hypothetical protein
MLNNELKRDGDSKKNHYALARFPRSAVTLGDRHVHVP